MYGINLKYKKPFYAVCIGGAIGGAITGAAHAGTTGCCRIKPLHMAGISRPRIYRVDDRMSGWIDSHLCPDLDYGNR